MPGDPGVTVVTNARVYYTTRAAAGASGARHSLRPLIFSGQDVQDKTRAKHAARSRSHIQRSRVGSKTGAARSAGAAAAGVETDPPPFPGPLWEKHCLPRATPQMITRKDSSVPTAPPGRSPP